MLQQLVEPAGKAVLDVGCGSGALVRALTALGAHMIGVEVSEQQLAAARAANGARYLVGRAEALPLDDGVVDAALFMRSLHHVPVAEMPRALAEAARVVRPGGLVHVAEPLAEGEFFELVSVVDDERAVRAAAQRALAEAEAVGLEAVTRREYDVRIEIGGLEALRTRVVGADPARAATFDSRRGELEQALEQLGEPGTSGPGRHFLQPMRAVLLRAVAP